MGAGAVRALVVVVEQVVGRVELGSCHLAGEVEMHRPRHAGPQVPEGVGGVLVDPVRGDQPLAVLLHADRRRLLVAALDAALRVIAADGHVAGQDQERGTGGVGGADVHDHVREPRPLGARAGRDLAGDPGEAVGGGAHAALGAAAVGGDALGGDCVDHLVVAGRAEERLEPLVGAGAGEDLGAVHRELGRVGRLAQSARDVVGDRDRPLLAVDGGGPGLVGEQGGGADSGSARSDESAARNGGSLPRPSGLALHGGLGLGRALRFTHCQFSWIGTAPIERWFLRPQLLGTDAAQIVNEIPDLVVVELGLERRHVQAGAELGGAEQIAVGGPESPALGVGEVSGLKVDVLERATVEAVADLAVPQVVGAAALRRGLRVRRGVRGYHDVLRRFAADGRVGLAGRGRGPRQGRATRTSLRGAL